MLTVIADKTVLCMLARKFGANKSKRNNLACECACVRGREGSFRTVKLTCDCPTD